MNRTILTAACAIGSGALVWIFWPSDADALPVDINKTSDRTIVTADNPDQLQALMRKAFTSGSTVKVVDVNSVTQSYSSRKPTDLEVARAKKVTDMLIRQSRSPKDLSGLDALDKEISIADTRYTEAVVMASKEIIDAGDGFVIESMVPQFKSGRDFHYWNMTIKGGLLYAAVDLSKYPDVRSLRDKFYSLRDFEANDGEYTWNGRSIEQRKEMVAMAQEASKRFEASKAEAYGLIKKSKMGTITAEEQVRLDEMIQSGDRDRALMNAIPPSYDPVSFDIR